MAYPREDSVFLKTSGGGENFTVFLEKELIPYVDSHYPTSPKRMLIDQNFEKNYYQNNSLNLQ